MLKQRSVQSVGLFSATCLVIGNMLGSGVYMMPANMARAGGAISLFSWAIILVGIIALVLCFVQLNLLSENHGGGPYYYVRMGFGFRPAYVINFIYIVANLVAITSMLSIITGTMSLLFGQLWQQQWLPPVIELALVWLLTLLNIQGARIVSFLQSSSLSFVLFPIILVIGFGAYYFNWNIFSGNINPLHLPLITVTNNAYNNILWAFIGVESAIIIANIVRNPARNVPLATIAAVFTVAIIYVGVYICAMGVLGYESLIKSSTPLILVAQKIFSNKYIEYTLIVTATIDCISAILGWLLVTGHSIARSAQDNLINPYFSKLNANNAPYRSLITGAIVVSITVICTMSEDAVVQFNKIINASVVLYLVAYIGAMLALVPLLLRSNNRWTAKLMYIMLAIIAVLFCTYSIIITAKIYLLIAFYCIMTGWILSLRAKN